MQLPERSLIRTIKENLLDPQRIVKLNQKWVSGSSIQTGEIEELKNNSERRMELAQNGVKIALLTAFIGWVSHNESAAIPVSIIVGLWQQVRVCLFQERLEDLDEYKNIKTKETDKTNSKYLPNNLPSKSRNGLSRHFLLFYLQFVDRTLLLC